MRPGTSRNTASASDSSVLREASGEERARSPRGARVRVDARRAPPRSRARGAVVSSSARASAERGPSSNRPSSPKSEPSSSTATSDSRPSGERVRIAMRPLTMPNSSLAASPWRKSTSLRATVRIVACCRRTSSVSGGSAPRSWVVSRIRRSGMVPRSVVMPTRQVGERHGAPGEDADGASGILALRPISPDPFIGRSGTAPRSRKEQS